MLRALTCPGDDAWLLCGQPNLLPIFRSLVWSGNVPNVLRSHKQQLIGERRMQTVIELFDHDAAARFGIARIEGVFENRNPVMEEDGHLAHAAAGTRL